MSIELITSQEANHRFPIKAEGDQEFLSDIIVFDGEDALLVREAFETHAFGLDSSREWNATVQAINEWNYPQSRAERSAERKRRPRKLPLLGDIGWINVEPVYIELVRPEAPGTEAQADESSIVKPKEITEVRVIHDSLNALKKDQRTSVAEQRAKAEKIKNLTRSLYYIAFADNEAA